VAVEKLVAPKFAKIKSRQDALQTTFSVFLDIFYLPNLAVWDEKGVFQQPLSIALIDPLPGVLSVTTCFRQACATKLQHEGSVVQNSWLQGHAETITERRRLP
jgi:hypothetical protein